MFSQFLLPAWYGTSTGTGAWRLSSLFLLRSLVQSIHFGIDSPALRRSCNLMRVTQILYCLQLSVLPGRAWKWRLFKHRVPDNSRVCMFLSRAILSATVLTVCALPSLTAASGLICCGSTCQTNWKNWVYVNIIGLTELLDPWQVRSRRRVYTVSWKAEPPGFSGCRRVCRVRVYCYFYSYVNKQ